MHVLAERRGKQGGFVYNSPTTRAAAQTTVAPSTFTIPTPAPTAPFWAPAAVSVAAAAAAVFGVVVAAAAVVTGAGGVYAGVVVGATEVDGRDADDDAGPAGAAAPPPLGGAGVASAGLASAPVPQGMAAPPGCVGLVGGVVPPVASAMVNRVVQVRFVEAGEVN